MSAASFRAALYQVTLQASSTAELYDNVSIMERKMRDLPTIQDVNSNLQVNTPQMNVRHRSQAGVGARCHRGADSDGARVDAFGSRQISTIYSPTNEYQVILEVKPEFQNDPDGAGKTLYHAPNAGKLVPLSAVASFSTRASVRAGESLRRAARHDHLVQPASRRFA